VDALKNVNLQVFMNAEVQSLQFQLYTWKILHKIIGPEHFYPSLGVLSVSSAFSRKIWNNKLKQILISSFIILTFLSFIIVFPCHSISCLL
jgi:hypothetical protein